MFYEGQNLTVAPYPVSDGEDGVLASYTLFVDGYEGELTVHMLGDAHGKLYLIDGDGNRVPAPSKADGQYILFTLDNGGSFVYVSAPPVSDHRVWIAAGAGLFVIGAIALTIRRRKKKASVRPSEEKETDF